VTEGAQETRLYWHGDVRRFRPPEVQDIDSTEPEIFLLLLSSRVFTPRAILGKQPGCHSISSIFSNTPGLSGITTREEIQECLVEVF